MKARGNLYVLAIIAAGSMVLQEILQATIEGFQSLRRHAPTVAGTAWNCNDYLT